MLKKKKKSAFLASLEKKKTKKNWKSHPAGDKWSLPP